MKDYLVTITVKNNVLLKVMRDNGFTTAASLSRASGVTEQVIGCYLNFKRPPFTSRGFTPSILKLSKFFKVLPEDMFPPQHLGKTFNKNKVSVEIGLGGVMSMLETKNPERLLELKEISGKINLSLLTLGDREKDIIEHRFGLNGKTEKTLEEISHIFGVTSTRIQQIERAGIRKLKNQSSQLQDLI